MQKCTDLEENRRFRYKKDTKDIENEINEKHQISIQQKTEPIQSTCYNVDTKYKELWSKHKKKRGLSQNSKGRRRIMKEIKHTYILTYIEEDDNLTFS